MLKLYLVISRSRHVQTLFEEYSNWGQGGVRGLSLEDFKLFWSQNQRALLPTGDAGTTMTSTADADSEAVQLFVATTGSRLKTLSVDGFQ